MMDASLDLALLAAPFAAGLLVLVTHVPLGIEVLRRGIIFIDLAIAQVAALGVIVAQLLGWETPFAVQASAAAAALAGAVALHWSEKFWPDIQEALIGLVFVVAAAAGILLLAGHPHGGEHLKDLLAGQILWVNWGQLWPVALLYTAILGLWLCCGRRLGRAGFYVLFALAVTSSVQLVGVLLVFASLIAPAVASHGLTAARRWMTAFGIGMAGYALGLVASLWFDLPAGAAVVCALGMLAGLGLTLFRAR